MNIRSIALKTLVAILIVVTLASTTWAECAWVLWVYTPLTATLDPYNSYVARIDCDAAVVSIREDNRKARQEGRPVGHVDPTCLPDTVDPRGPKGR